MYLQAKHGRIPSIWPYLVLNLGFHINGWRSYSSTPNIGFKCNQYCNRFQALKIAVENGAWGNLVHVVSTVQTWKVFDALSQHQQNIIMHGIRGGHSMLEEIRAINWCSQEVGTRPYFHWEVSFTRMGILIGARGLVNVHAIFFLESQAQCKIAWKTQFDVVVEKCNFQQIRAVGYLEVTWHVDLHPSKVDIKWDLWVHEGLPLHMVKWDLGEYEWSDPFTNKREPSTPLLQYTVKLGRHILSAQRKQTNNQTIRQLSGLTESFLNGVWKGLWETSLPAKVTAFRWLVMHDAIWVGSKLHRQVILNCQRNGQHVETQRHALWNCIHACSVWMLILRLVSHSDGCESFCWGSVVWGRCGRFLLNYDVAVQPFMMGKETIW